MPLKPVATLLDLLHCADRRIAVVDPELDVNISYASLREQVLAMADGLTAAGIHTGDRVAMAMPNGPQAILVVLAASIVGTVVPVNPSYAYDEFLFLLKDTNARVLLLPETGGASARKAAAELDIPVIAVQTNGARSILLCNATKSRTTSMPSSDDIALALYTSGSTGKPNRIPLRHRNLVASAANIINVYTLSEGDVSLCVMPSFHVHGLMASTLATLLSGGTVVVPRTFKLMTFWRLVRQYRVTWYSAVPTIHRLLLARSRIKRETGSLRFIRSCSAPFSAEVIRAMEEMFGVPLVEAYGMTEASHQIASNPLPPHNRKPGSVGLGTGTHISIMDPSGNHLKAGRRGEVVIRGPNVFQGYENNAEANSKAFAKGWFRTGDEGYLDANNYLYLTGRLKDIIVRGGEKIAPSEIDKILLNHPAVADAAAFGYAHPVLGEEVAAAVVLRNSANETESSLLRYCQEHLADFKCPQKLYFVKNIPSTQTGKIRRSVLATLLSASNGPVHTRKVGGLADFSCLARRQADD